MTQFLAAAITVLSVNLISGPLMLENAETSNVAPGAVVPMPTYPLPPKMFNALTGFPLPSGT